MDRADDRPCCSSQRLNCSTSFGLAAVKAVKAVKDKRKPQDRQQQDRDGETIMIMTPTDVIEIGRPLVHSLGRNPGTGSRSRRTTVAQLCLTRLMRGACVRIRADQNRPDANSEGVRVSKVRDRLARGSLNYLADATRQIGCW